MALGATATKNPNNKYGPREIELCQLNRLPNRKIALISVAARRATAIEISGKSGER